MGPASDPDTLNVAAARIADLTTALASKRVTSTELALRYLTRIARYDRQGVRLNAVPELNPRLFDEARAADERRGRGAALGPLDGVPYLAKASYAVRDLPITAGSPAFAGLVAREDAHVVARLREAGAVLVGLTNMPPMAAGGMQRGLYGRAESPFNHAFLPSAHASGSSNGSGAGLAAGFGAFALAEETWSSGRAPASCNGLVAYTPSRGLISMRGNWPLIPTMDVVVPYARTVGDLLTVLDVLVGDDAETRGDFWRAQQAVPLPAAASVRPPTFASLCDPSALAGRRVGVPRMYVGRDPESTRPVPTRSTVLELWECAAASLRALGAEVLDVDFPLVSGYDRDRPGARSMVERGLVPEGFGAAEGELVVWAWDDYLRANGDPALASLGAVDGALIFPRLPSELPDRYEGIPDWTTLPALARAGLRDPAEIPGLAAGLEGLEEVRRRDLEAWMDAERLDCLAFPALADIAPADADRNPRSADVAWRNGTWVANGNQALRHHGVPTVTVPMGLLPDIGMPVGLTFAGRGYDDAALLRYAYAFDAVAPAASQPPRTPARSGDVVDLREVRAGGAPPLLELDAAVSPVGDDGLVEIAVDGRVQTAEALDAVEVLVDGEAIELQRDGDRIRGSVRVPFERHYAVHSPWRRPYGSLVTAYARDVGGRTAAAYCSVGGI